MTVLTNRKGRAPTPVMIAVINAATTTIQRDVSKRGLLSWLCRTLALKGHGACPRRRPG